MRRRKKTNLLTIVSQYQPKRNRWSRFFSPSFTEKGKDKDAQFYMKQLIENLGRINEPSQRIRTNLNELKRFFHNVNAPEIKNYINQVPYDDWGKTSDFINQIPSIIDYSERSIADEQLRNDVVQSLSGFSQHTERDMNTVNERMQDIQNISNVIRSQKPVVGRGTGQNAGSSPLNEFSQLESALNKLYDNPLSRESRQYVQKAYSRLDDRLRSVQLQPDEGLNNWTRDLNNQDDFLSRFEEPNSPQQSAAQPQLQQPSQPPSPQPQNNTSPPTSGGNSVETAANLLKQLFNPTQLNSIIDSLQNAALNPQQGDYSNLHALIALLDQGSNSKMPNQNNPSPVPQQPPPPPPAANATPAGSDVSGTQNSATSTSPTPGVAPIQQRRSGRTMSHDDRMNTDWSELEETQEDYMDDNEKQAEVKELLVKVANSIKDSDTYIADALEEYLAEENEMEEVNFPSLGKIL